MGARAVIGNRCKIQNNISIYDDVELEDDVFCGPSMVFTNVYNPRAFIVRKHEYRKTLVRQGRPSGPTPRSSAARPSAATPSSAPGAVVNGDVPDFALMVGVPARQKGWMCKCAVKLVFAGGRAKCEACGESYVLENGVVREA